ncbi:MAG: hypothetical protein KF784_08595 [Fimbriimonadaceae bacterium]|nr:hypothetical protein [Fimbriimonadaceae bacterium]
MTQAEHTSDNTRSEATASGNAFVWEIRLHKKQPQKFWVVLTAALFAGLVGIFLLQSLVMGVIGFVAIMLATADFWMPIKYRIDDHRASARVGLSTTAMEWSAVKRVLASDLGVKLSPLEKESKLSQFRGVFLRFDGNKEDVLNAITQRWSGEIGLLD